ncbi:MAG: DUF2752 domain-containing protein [Myxococcota bacterium]|nr:DUF2752 domain-containing protein [Myxococcota bacterium]
MNPTWRDRGLALLLGAPAWTILGIALSLSPDPIGHGTHKQLGLGTCSILSWTGYPCPMCGMTTTFTHMAHLQWWQALKTQPFGVVLFLLTLVTGILAIAEIAIPKGRFKAIWAWIMERELAVSAGLVAGLLAGWGYKLLIWPL